MTRLLIDQRLPATTALLLRNSGIDALHTSGLGLAKATDEELVAFAISEKRWIVTLAGNFHAILATL